MLNYRRVYGGSTEGEDSSLCEYCIYSLVIKGQAESEKLSICDRLWHPVHVPFRVTECSCYADKRLPDVREMEDIAWELTPKAPAKSAGFATSIELTNGTTEDSS
jgi:hypothetical protein